MAVLSRNFASGCPRHAQGDLAGARKLQEETLDIRRRVLGPEHPDTSTSAWNLLRTLQDSGELAQSWLL
jgi:hypothetical protein